ncbi:hypothetical protein [Fructilactobacillus frigidiflavus]|uniref:hypothetical protein n=1 Tax=Fructilactobacillus frigidiflavus TaxID=3242688 RepID=UPI0037572D0A
MTKTLLSDQMKAGVTDIMPQFFTNEFVKGIAAGSLPKAALISYTQQDNLYLENFLHLYQAVLGDLDPELLAVTEHDINSENGAHQVLLRVAGTDTKAIMTPELEQKATTKHYLNHMQASLEQSPALGLASMQACPYVYNYVANELVKQGKNNAANPFKDWIDFYASSEENFGETMFKLLNQKVDSKDYPAAIEAFRISVIDELKFFAQAMEA